MPCPGVPDRFDPGELALSRGDTLDVDLETLARILARDLRRLRVRRVLSVTPLVVFLVVSAFSLWGTAALPSLPENLRDFLGYGPKPRQLAFVLFVYGFCATLLASSRFLRREPPQGSVSDLGLLTAFYVFYSFSRPPTPQPFAVLWSGLAILGLECANAWRWFGEEIERECRLLGQVEVHLRALERDREGVSTGFRPPP